jgi:hypothetical protein
MFYKDIQIVIAPKTERTVTIGMPLTRVQDVVNLYYLTHHRLRGTKGEVAFADLLEALSKAIQQDAKE